MTGAVRRRWWFPVLWLLPVASFALAWAQGREGHVATMVLFLVLGVAEILGVIGWERSTKP